MKLKPRSFLFLFPIFALANSPHIEPVKLTSDCRQDSSLFTVEEYYRKQVVRIPMRDGTKLHTHIYIPLDDSQKYAILMNRTPYSVFPYGEDTVKSSLGPSLLLAKRGYIFVYQDVRGKFMSEGEFANVRPYTEQGVNENTDTYDTIEWLLANLSNHNGKVGLWGISYPGFYTSMGIINSHPAIAAASPQAPIADWFWDDVHRNGAFSFQLSFTFLSSFGQKRERPTTRWSSPFSFPDNDKYQFFKQIGPLSNVNKHFFNNQIDFWNDIAEHPNYDHFWQTRNILPHLKNIQCAVLTVGGLYDAEDLYGAWQTYGAIERQNPGIDNIIVMGPWSHGAWSRESGNQLGDAHFGSNTSAYYQKNIEFPFFEFYLYGGKRPDFPEARIFETGTNTWRTFDSWPPAKTVDFTLFLHADSSLSSVPSTKNRQLIAFKSNPAKPVPYTQENNVRWGKRFMAEDQRFLVNRKDVLQFMSPVLQENQSIAGSIEADLWVSTSRSAADWIVKIIDVHPKSGTPSSGDRTGPQIMVRWEILRGRFRNSFSHPEPFTPRKPTRIVIKLQDVLHTFKKGHRIMVQIQSSFFPFFDINPQTYVDNIFQAQRSDFKKAKHKVYCSDTYPSKIVFRKWNPPALQD